VWVTRYFSRVRCSIQSNDKGNIFAIIVKCIICNIISRRNIPYSNVAFLIQMEKTNSRHNFYYQNGLAILLTHCNFRFYKYNVIY